MLGFDLPGAHYEMIATHMTWNKTFVDKYFPSRKTITILRDPTTLLESSWKYYYILMSNPTVWKKEPSQTSQAHQLYQLLENPSKFYNDTLKMKPSSYRHVLRSQMASFGFGKKTYEHNLDRETVKQWMQQIDDDFDLVLIMEYFDYGLALLAIELCWPLKELAYLKANSAKTIRVEKKNYNRELIEVLNYPDFMLYQHFNRTFWRKIEEVGFDTVQKMSAEIERLSEDLENECVVWAKSFHFSRF